MPSTRPRSTLRAASRDQHRATARPNHTAGKNRAERRKHGWRGDISAQAHGPHPMRRHFDGLLLGRQVPTSGQVRIDAKRNARAEYWNAFQAGRQRIHQGLMSINEHRRLLGLLDHA